MNHKIISGIIAALLAGTAATAAEPPAPCGAVPTEQQLKWLRMEWYAFVHFGLNTYTNKEWGYGDEDPKMFNPSKFDADKIVSTFKQAGMKGMIYTAKHHDGFCLWPTKSTEHNITKSPWKDGKGDVAKEFADACKKNKIKFGVYLSPWDRNCAEYGKPGYLDVYYKQISELLTNYGPIFEIWFDGANGGDGYYGGAKERRNIGKADDYYNFTKVVELIRGLQPKCIIWGAACRGDATWGGSEKGFVLYPYWNVHTNQGDINARQKRKMDDTPAKNERWVSFEADTTINGAGWFWHPNQAGRVKNPEHLMNEVYMKSVGYGANLILNVAANRDGELDPADVDALQRFGEARRQLLSTDFAAKAKGTASNVRGGDKKNFGASKLVDGDIESYWCTDDGVTTGDVVLKLAKPATFDVVRVREQIRLGQRVQDFAIDAWVNGAWETIDAEDPQNGKSIGNQVMRRVKPVTTDQVRLRITKSRACPCISELSLLKMPDFSKISAPADKQDTGLAKKDWKCAEAPKAIDGKADTFWHADKAPASFTVDMGAVHKVASFSYTPRQDGKVQDMTDRYTMELSKDGKAWKKVSEGEFGNLRANPIEQHIEFPATEARYFRFTATRSIEGSGSSAAEINIYPAK
ncbi:MAG: alpha-L-fucosidase [Akkermansia sp.]|nr:alpha-L-fucosidase [Akkermansia sp.]